MNQERLLRVVLAPHMSEKAAITMEKNGEYVFHVGSDSTKPEVKEAVEQLFKTKVEKVRILNMKGKPRRFGQIQGKSKAWKKAYVTLKDGERIDFAGAQ
jgi:large subunit ribosomal protein L23